ncbi:hypothetical protein D3C72_1407210 [compost metagenome]
MAKNETEIIVSGSVAAPMLESVHLAGEIIALCSRAIDAHAFISPLNVGSANHHIQLKTPKNIIEHKRKLKSLVFAQVFYELARGIRQTLEAAYTYCIISEHVGSRFNLPETLKKTRKIANKSDTGFLINAVSKRMTEPLGIETELRSIHKVRNCMEHRFGIVGEKDLEDGEDTLTLTLPRWEVLSHPPDGRQIELAPKAGNDTPTASLYVVRTTKMLTYNLGDSINFDESEIAELLSACQIIAADIEYRLPHNGYELVGTRASEGLA